MEPPPQIGPGAGGYARLPREVVVPEGYEFADAPEVYGFRDMPLGLRPEDDTLEWGLRPMDISDDDFADMVEVRVYRTPPEFVAATAVLFQGAWKGLVQLATGTRRVVRARGGHRYVIFPRFKKIY